jgi:hypothetical protein
VGNNIGTTDKQTKIDKKETRSREMNRMSLSAVTRGRVAEPFRVLIYGAEGVGKSSFGAGAPKPVFLDIESGSSELDVPRFPKPESWTDVLDAIRELTTADHGYESLVVDTLDALEALCWAHVCKTRSGEKGKALESIESLPFGKGYAAALDEWRVFWSHVERMSTTKRMNVILVAHSHMKKFQNPEDDDYERFELKMHKSASGFFKERCKAVLFARHEAFANKDSKTKRIRGVSSGARVIHTQWNAAFDAKNRYGLPETLPLEWQAFEDAVKNSLPLIKARIEELLAGADEALATKVRDAVEKAGSDSAELARIADKLAAKLQIADKESGQ